ncbi:hypothetical protein L0152_04365, partial [bacterium]|nr:hypothetical protein [bacterium]
MSIHEIEKEISKVMPLDEFLQIQRRLRELHREENVKLQALGELQQVFLSANTDAERDMVKQAVAQIRELSKATRAQIRELNSKIAQHMSLEQA